MKQEGMGLFRLAVIADLIVVVWSLFEPDDGSFDDVFDTLDEGAVAILSILVLAAIAGWFISLIGLLMLKNWARWIYLASMVVLIAISIRMTGVYETLWADSLSRVGTVVMLNILFISHFSRPEAFD